jgi:RimJ/RimL family protein N-acetyltransferase
MISASLVETLPSLTTARLVLRPFVDTDFAALRAIESDPEILRFRSRPVISPAMTRERLQEYVAARYDPARARFPFAITLRADGTLIGDCGLTLLANEPGGAFLWYSVNRQYWGNGYATEAAATVINFGLAILRLSDIEARCHWDNRASVRVLEKIGMQRVPPGQSAPADHVEFSIRRKEEDCAPCLWIRWIVMPKRFRVLRGDFDAHTEEAEAADDVTLLVIARAC